MTIELSYREAVILKLVLRKARKLLKPPHHSCVTRSRLARLRNRLARRFARRPLRRIEKKVTDGLRRRR
jgi:hypothetical protein